MDVLNRNHVVLTEKLLYI